MDLDGQLRLVTPSTFVRLLRYATGIEVLGTIARGLGRTILRLERRGELRLDGGTLHIVQKRSILGRAPFEKQTLLPLSELVSISVFDGRAELLQSAGLGALAAGTLLGSGLLVEGLRTPGLAPSLVTLGLVLAAVGGIVDFALERALARAKVRPAANLRIVPSRGPAFLLSGLAPESAQAWLETARQALQGPDPVP